MLLHRIETYLRATRTPPARFGREALGDSRFVFDLRDGREARPVTVQRVLAFLKAREEQASSDERSSTQPNAHQLELRDLFDSRPNRNCRSTDTPPATKPSLSASYDCR